MIQPEALFIKGLNGNGLMDLNGYISYAVILKNTLFASQLSGNVKL